MANKANTNNWDIVLFTEVNGEGQGTIWLGENENLAAITYTNKAAILLRGQALTDWCENGQRTKHSQRTISVKTMGHSLTSTYMPVWRGNNEEEIDQARNDLKNHVEWANKEEVLLVGGDFNAHIGQNEDRAGICGKFGLRQTNRQGLELIEFCEENNLCYVNSYFNHKRRGTWFNPALRRWYELDGFLMRSNDRHKLVKKVCTVGDISLSDHKPKKITIELNKPKKKKIFVRQKSKRINWEKLRDEETATRYRDRVELLIEEKERNDNNLQENGTGWSEITEVVTKAAEDICGIQEKKIENPWMAGRDDEINRMRARITGNITLRNDKMESLRQEQNVEERQRIQTQLTQVIGQLKEARTESNKYASFCPFVRCTTKMAGDVVIKKSLRL